MHIRLGIKLWRFSQFLFVCAACLIAETSMAATLENRVAALEKQVAEKKSPTIKGAAIEFGGEIKLEWLDAQDTQDADADPHAHFQLNRVVLEPRVKIADNLTFDSELWFKENSAQVKEFHIKLSDLVGYLWVDAGLYERWPETHHNRLTEGYSLYGSELYKDRALTLAMGSDTGPLYTVLSVGNGYKTGRQQVAQDGASRSQIIADELGSPAQTSDKQEYGVNIGYKLPVSANIDFDILGFYYKDSLSADDKTFLRNSLNSSAFNFNTNDDEKTRYGFAVKYNIAGVGLFAGFVRLKDSNLKRSATAIEAWSEIAINPQGEFFTAITPFVSYSNLNVKTEKTEVLPGTWDRQKIMLACILDLYKNTKLKVEGSLNGEKTGGGDIDNDEMLVQLEIKF